MGLANEDSFDWVRSYFKRMLLVPERVEQVLVTKDDLARAKKALQQCQDADAVNAWLDQYARADAQLRCRNALYQRKCSQGLQRLSLKKDLYQDLAALAAEQGFTLNQAVEYLLGLHRGEHVLVAKYGAVPPEATPALGEEDEAYREQMILWSLCRSTGRKEDA